MPCHSPGNRFLSEGHQAQGRQMAAWAGWAESGKPGRACLWQGASRFSGQPAPRHSSRSWPGSPPPTGEGPGQGNCVWPCLPGACRKQLLTHSGTRTPGAAESGRRGRGVLGPWTWAAPGRQKVQTRHGLLCLALCWWHFKSVFPAELQAPLQGQPHLRLHTGSWPRRSPPHPSPVCTSSTTAGPAPGVPDFCRVCTCPALFMTIGLCPKESAERGKRP